MAEMVCDDNGELVLRLDDNGVAIVEIDAAGSDGMLAIQHADATDTMN